MGYNIKSNSKEDFNSEPVYYCKHCLSLKIKTVSLDLDISFCDDCGGTDIDTAYIGEWEKLYKERYGFNYLNNK